MCISLSHVAALDAHISSSHPFPFLMSKFFFFFLLGVLSVPLCDVVMPTLLLFLHHLHQYRHQVWFTVRSICRFHNPHQPLWVFQHTASFSLTDTIRVSVAVEGRVDYWSELLERSTADKCNSDLLKREKKWIADQFFEANFLQHVNASVWKWSCQIAANANKLSCC